MRAADKYSYLFGPVLSRRFGRSLGVDLVARKICAFDCLFCQVGATTSLTCERREYVPTEAVIAEMKAWFGRNIPADFITLSGSGEPTLHSRFGDVLETVRSAAPIRTALLTNGALLSLKEVRSAACKANVVKVSVSAWDQDSFARINRPHASLKFDGFVDGLRTFRAEFPGELWIEVFALPGINASQEAMGRIAKVLGNIRPDRIHLNTAVRPPSDRSAVAVPRQLLNSFVSCFDPPAEVLESVGSGGGIGVPVEQEAVLSVLRRRPCTAEDIAGAFGMTLADVADRLGSLERGGSVRKDQRGNNTYYVAAQDGCTIAESGRRGRV